MGMGEILGTGRSFPILISEAGVEFSLGEVDQLTGWPVGRETNKRHGGPEA
jgi:hypothetical protein